MPAWAAERYRLTAETACCRAICSAGAREAICRVGARFSPDMMLSIKPSGRVMTTASEPVSWLSSSIRRKVKVSSREGSCCTSWKITPVSGLESRLSTAACKGSGCSLRAAKIPRQHRAVSPAASRNRPASLMQRRSWMANETKNSRTCVSSFGFKIGCRKKYGPLLGGP